jgi:hypothetical protein
MLLIKDDGLITTAGCGDYRHVGLQPDNL